MRIALCLLLSVAALAHCAAVDDVINQDVVEQAPEFGFEDVGDETREGRAGKRRAPTNGTSTRSPTTPVKRTTPTGKRTTPTVPVKRTTSTNRVIATTPMPKMPLRNVTLVVKSTMATTATTSTTATTTAKGKKKASLAKTTPSTPTEAETPKLYYNPNRRPRPEVVVDKMSTKPTKPMTTGLRLPEGATAAGLTKPTKYHYYPHNQHIYLLPECAIQQVCNAVYVRLNFTQPLCACPTRYQEPCSASLREDDLHTTPLVTDPRGRALTLVKTCERVAEMRRCKAPRDWALLALQNVRTGKSHYLVLCRCPEDQLLEGPMNHDQPSYASVPGIRVYGMMCVQSQAHAHRQARPLRTRRHLNQRRTPALPWARIHETVTSLGWDP